MSRSPLSRRAAFMGGGVTLAALPAFAQNGTPAPTGAPTGAPPRPRPPDNVRGFSRERLGRIRGVMLAEAERGSFPGAVTIIARNGEIVHHEAHGHLDAAKTKQMPRDAIFLQASMTKPITTAIAMQLVEEGRIKLDDPIGAHLPELANLTVEIRAEGRDPQRVAPTRPPTVHDLLRHTSGFVYAGASPSPAIKGLYDLDNIEAREGPILAEEMLKRLGAIPLAFQPGTQFFYSISTDILGLLIERVSRTRLDRLFEQRITGPLGMRDTQWFVPANKRARLAEAPDSDAQKTTMWGEYRILEDASATSYFKGGAGLVSTAADYMKFAQMIANGGTYEGRRYLAEPVVRFMLSNHLVGIAGTPAASTGPGYGFGLGFAVRLADGVGTAPGSPGDAMWAGAWGTSFTIDRAEGLVAILMAQGPSNRFRTRMIFKNLVYGAMVDSAREG